MTELGRSLFHGSGQRRRQDFFYFPSLAHSLHSLKPTLESGNVSKAIWLFSSPSPPHVTERGLAKKDGNKKKSVLEIQREYKGKTKWVLLLF